MYQSSRVSGQQEEQTVAPKAAPVSPQATPAPGEIRVMKRNGAVSVLMPPKSSSP